MKLLRLMLALTASAPAVSAATCTTPVARIGSPTYLCVLPVPTMPARDLGAIPSAALLLIGTSSSETVGFKVAIVFDDNGVERIETIDVPRVRIPGMDMSIAYIRALPIKSISVSEVGKQATFSSSDLAIQN